MKLKFAQSSSQIPRTARTFALQMALSEAQKEAMGERIRELRGPRSQKVVADRVGVTVRAYQAWELGESEPQWDNLQAVARVFKVETDFITNGPQPETPDLLSSMGQLDRLEAKLDQLLDRIPDRSEIDGAIKALDGFSAALGDRQEADGEAPRTEAAKNNPGGARRSRSGRKRQAG